MGLDLSPMSSDDNDYSEYTEYDDGQDSLIAGGRSAVNEPSQYYPQEQSRDYPRTRQPQEYPQVQYQDPAGRPRQASQQRGSRQAPQRPPARGQDYDEQGYQDYGQVPAGSEYSDYEVCDDDIMSPDQVAQALTQQQAPRQQAPARGYPQQTPPQGSAPAFNVYNSGAEPAVSAPNNEPVLIGTDDYDPTDIRAAEDRSIRNMEKRASRDSRSVRRSHMSKIQPSGVADAAKKSRRYRNTTLVIIVLVLLLAAYQTLVPKTIPSDADIATIARQVNNDTGFPLQEGAGVAQQFIQAYLQADGGTASAQVMAMFMNGIPYAEASKDTKAGDTGLYPNITMPTNVKQKIEYGPYVYGYKPLDSNGATATYEVGALVYRVDEDGNVISDANGNPKYTMMFYQVDLSYDVKQGLFTVFKDSPTRIAEPSMEPAASNSAVQPLLPGNQEEAQDMETESMDAFVKQYMQAWAASDSDALTTLVSPKSGTPGAKSGLHGTVTLAQDPDYKVYSPPDTDSWYRILSTVEWSEDVTDDASIRQQSTYVIKVAKDGDKLSVVDIQPYPWYPDPAYDTESDDEQ